MPAQPRRPNRCLVGRTLGKSRTRTGSHSSMELVGLATRCSGSGHLKQELGDIVLRLGILDRSGWSLGTRAESPNMQRRPHRGKRRFPLIVLADFPVHGADDLLDPCNELGRTGRQHIHGNSQRANGAASAQFTPDALLHRFEPPIHATTLEQTGAVPIPSAQEPQGRPPLGSSAPVDPSCHAEGCLSRKHRVRSPAF
jgi:hypothetical protein